MFYIKKKKANYYQCLTMKVSKAVKETKISFSELKLKKGEMYKRILPTQSNSIPLIRLSHLTGSLVI